jgi:hypothetical protein
VGYAQKGSQRRIGRALRGLFQAGQNVPGIFFCRFLHIPLLH